MLRLPDINDETVPLVSALCGEGTYGSPDSSVTFGLSNGMVDSYLAEKRCLWRVVKSLSAKTSYFTEN
ncbi:hypothetical protein ACFL47_05730 [Candidatus Latescibacterota bacterium]